MLRLSCQAASAVHTFWSRPPHRRGRCQGSRNRRMTDSCRYFLVLWSSSFRPNNASTTLLFLVIFLAFSILPLRGSPENDAMKRLLQITCDINKAKRKSSEPPKTWLATPVTSCLRKVREKPFCPFFIFVEFCVCYEYHLRYARAMHVGRYDGRLCSVVVRATAVRPRLNPMREAERRYHTRTTRIQMREHIDSGSDNIPYVT